jgi:dipeptidyl aminopeptidase/acylaminoacyl peptidase
LDNHKTIKYVGKLSAASGVMRGNNSYYLDLSDEDGWSHIYLYPTTGGQPKQLTSGKWEVRHIVAIDRSRGLVYFTSTEHHPTESHPYVLSLSSGLKKSLVNDTQPGYWDMQVSSKAGFYTLNYQGPNAPFQELYAFNNTKEPIRIINDNEEFVKQLNQFALPSTTIRDLAHPSGFNLSSMLRLPPNFNASKKYPVLLTPYGGPGSQEVTKRLHSADWKTYISSDPQLEYITFTVDNRGTGWRGRKFRSIFAKAMGTIDAEDQIWAARELAKAYPWVDSQRIGIWGWSNGGYLTAKVVEHNSDVISFAMITAPTSDCRLYDSMYTERYMGMPDVEKAAYDRAAVRNATGFKNIPGGVVIQHGTGDDNVHFQHTASLVDLLMGAGVGPDKLSTQFFTDSDHSIYYDNAQTFLYAQLTKKLLDEKKRVPGAPKLNHQYLNQNVAQRYNSRFGLDGDGVGDGFTTQWNMLAEVGHRTKQSPGGRGQYWGP